MIFDMVDGTFPQTANPDSAEHAHLANRSRFKIVKAAIAFSSVLLLMYAGFNGRQHAILQAKLADITVVCDQLQQQLDDDQRPAGSQLPAFGIPTTM